MNRMSGGAPVNTRIGMLRTSVSVIAKGWPSLVMASQVVFSASITAALIAEAWPFGHLRAVVSE